MRGAELAAALAVADGLSAELARGFRAPFPRLGFPEGQDPHSAADAWLDTLDCSAGSMHLLWCPGGAGSVAASLPAGADPSAAALLRCASASVTAAAAHACPQECAMPALVLTLEQPHACFGASLHAAVPAADITIGYLVGANEQEEQQAVHLGPPIAVLFNIALQQSSPVPLSGRSDQPLTAPVELRLSMHDISFALALEQTTALVCHGSCAHLKQCVTSLVMLCMDEVGAFCALDNGLLLLHPGLLAQRGQQRAHAPSSAQLPASFPGWGALGHQPVCGSCLSHGAAVHG